MPSPLSELRTLLAGPMGPTAGVVLAVTDADLIVSTRAGVQTLARHDATSYAAGDRVRIRSGALVGKLLSSQRVRIV